jgi:hypothetical protein
LDQALEWFQQLLTLVPSDPTFLNRLSDINMAESDKHAAFSYLNDVSLEDIIKYAKLIFDSF